MKNCNLDLDQTNIVPEDYQPLFEDLQGNILKGHGRDYSVHIFITFNLSSISEAKNWIQEFATHSITSAWKQDKEAALFREKKQTGELFANFLLSACGYRALGIGLDDFSWTFRAGLQAYKTQLNDPPVSEWEKGFQSKIDALILLADNDYKLLLEEARKIGKEVIRFAKIVNIETGKVLRNKNQHVIEHFGFADGVSQPLFLKRDIDKVKKEQGLDKWDPSAPLKLLLACDPHGMNENSYGSYCVYRKLEQNVEGFRLAQQKLANQLKGENPEQRAGASAVGRFQDGTPLTLYSSPQDQVPILNNFNYSDDPHEDSRQHQHLCPTPQQPTKCPYQAHARNVNPRGGENSLKQTLEQQRQHRIVRRAISYSDTPRWQQEKSQLLACYLEEHEEHLEEHLVNQLPNKKNLFENERKISSEDNMGLLFLCFQNEINFQFMILQKSWANKPNFVCQGTGVDALVGQGKQKDEPKWPQTWGESGTVPFNFSHFVTMKGGEFLFAPSISFLKNITSIDVVKVNCK